MPRFFASEPPENGAFIIAGDDARHIGRSLRMAVGEEITVCFERRDFICRLEKIGGDSAVAKILSEEPSKEPTVALTLYQALPKADKLELIIQKAVELGAVKIVPVMTRRCVARPGGAQFSKKLDRLGRIAAEAAKQSGRGIIPEVSGIISFEECLEDIKNLDLGIICYEKGGKRLNELSYPSGGSVGVIVGSEGGFEPLEAERARESGVTPVWLGDRILRCETAPLAAISIIMNITGNM